MKYDLIIVVRHSSSLDGLIITVQVIHSLPVRWISIWLAKSHKYRDANSWKRVFRILATTYPELQVPTFCGGEKRGTTDYNSSWVHGDKI